MAAVYSRLVNLYLLILLSCRSDVKKTRLQSYWKKLCEEEVSRKQRNDKILAELAEAEAHRSQLSAQSEKLRMAKVGPVYVTPLLPYNF